MLMLAQISLKHPLGSVFHLLEVAEKLQERGYRVKVVAPNLGQFPGKSSVSIQYIPTLHIRFVWIFMWQFFLFFYLVYYFVKEHPQVVYIRSAPLFIIPSFVAGLWRIPRVIEVNSFLYEELQLINWPKRLMTFVRILEKKVYENAVCVIVVTQRLKEALHRDYHLSRDRIFVIPNGVNTVLYRPEEKSFVRLQLGLKSPGSFITYVGTFAPWQGLKLLVRCAPIVRRRFPNVQFLIIGDGMEKEIILRSIRDQEIEDLFIFTGWVPYDAVPSYINAADVCVAPFDQRLNQYTGKSPLKVFAYWACAKPVVATDIPEIGELIEDVGGGIVVPPNDVQQLSEALVSLLENPELAGEMGKKGRTIVEQRLSWTSIAGKIDAVLTDCIIMP